jgi:hypothetical protein
VLSRTWPVCGADNEDRIPVCGLERQIIHACEELCHDAPLHLALRILPLGLRAEE